jgi:hypothetical protein
MPKPTAPAATRNARPAAARRRLAPPLPRAAAKAVAAPSRGYVTLDDPLEPRLAREDPALFLKSHPPPVLIDEVQYAPPLLPHLKIAVDSDRRPGAFWLAGSRPLGLRPHAARACRDGRAGLDAVGKPAPIR